MSKTAADVREGLATPHLFTTHRVKGPKYFISVRELPQAPKSRSGSET